MDATVPEARTAGRANLRSDLAHAVLESGGMTDRAAEVTRVVEVDGQEAVRETMLEHLGGGTRLREFVDHFHHAVLADPLLHDMFAAGKPTHSAHLTAFFEEVMGGRRRYTERLKGVEGLFDAHAGLCITEAQRQRFVDLMLASADAVGLPGDERFRSALRARIEAGSRFTMQFSQPGVAPLSPWPEVGTYEW